MSEPENAERLTTDSDLSLTAFEAAMKILKPVVNPMIGSVEVMLMFGPGGFYAADVISKSIAYTSGIDMTRHYKWRDYKDDEWCLWDRVTGRCVWNPGA